MGQSDPDRSGTQALVIGAGVAGIVAAIELRDAGFDVVVVEKASRLGGTWRENTCPGVACDVPSHLYGFSFEPNPDWSRTFAPGAEIQAYLESVAERRDVLDLIRFDTEISTLDHVPGGWIARTADGDRSEADVVIAATGVLHHPNEPDIDGLDSFAGPCFHSARWDHDVDVTGARIGIAGAGSTAVQITTAIAERRAHLAATFEAAFADVVVDASSPQLEVLQELCRANLEDNVADPDLRERLRRDHRAACKRLVVSPNYYEAVSRPNVRVVTDPDRLRRTRGRAHRRWTTAPLDTLVLATGLRVDRFLRPIEVTGRDGTRLDDVWEQRPTAYLGMSVPSFPNLFLLNGPNGPVGNFSLIEVAELQMAYLRQLLEPIREGNVREIAASPGATERFEASRVEAATNTVWVTGCRSWYLDDRGIPAAWPWTFGHHRDVLRHPDLEDFDLS